jgi:glycosyltransferase 2 family protein
MTLKRGVGLVIGVCFAAYFLFLIFKNIRFSDVKNELADVDPFWIGAALGAFVAGYTCRIERWRLMLRKSGPSITWTDCAGPFLASFAINNVLPFRAGDFARAFAFNSKLKTSSGIVVATLFVERVLDLLAVCAFLGIALSVSGMPLDSIAGIGSLSLIAAAAAISLLLLFPRVARPLLMVPLRVVASLSPRLIAKLEGEIEKGFHTIQTLGRGRAMLGLIFWSLAAWFAEGCTFWFCAFAIPTINAPSASWVALPVGTLSTLLPSTPGYVGTFDFFTAKSMAVFGNDPAAATAYALLVHALLWLPLSLAGGIYLLSHSFNFRRVYSD